MLDGINVLQEHFCRELSLAGCIFTSVFIISLAALYIICVVGARTRLKGPRSIKIFITIMVIIVICLVIICVLVNCYKYSNTWQEYSVTIDDSVKFNEFFSKYEIISQDGNIFRIKEINN